MLALPISFEGSTLVRRELVDAFVQRTLEQRSAVGCRRRFPGSAALQLVERRERWRRITLGIVVPDLIVDPQVIVTASARVLCRGA